MNKISLFRLAFFSIGVLAWSGTAMAQVPDQGLGRTWNKLDQDKKLVIGYLGGSITAGAGASNSNATSWRALTTAWFKQQFPQAQITEINASVSGTGSDLGNYRCADDLLSRHPDLVFVEFSVNDHGFKQDQELRWTEGIVRQIWKSNPAADIVFIHTATKAYCQDFYSKGTLPGTVIWQQEIASHYGIPDINVGKVLSQTIIDGKGTWETLTRDGTHPFDNGYAIYETTITDYLQAHRADKPQPPVTTLPAPVAPNPINELVFTDAWTLTATGWTKESQPVSEHWPHQLVSSTAGASFDFPFHGSAVGFHWLMSPDGGKIDYSIDDGPVQSFSNWDLIAAKRAHAKYTLLKDDLPLGDHVLHAKVSADKDAQSTGNTIRLGSVFVF